jgi:preprotein translocase subunit SecA
LSDLIYKNQYIKWRAVAQECLEMYKIGRPVLVGTTTIEKSELLAALLSEYGIPYRILNAKPENIESESEIIAQAGYRKAVTIATNMAGRGTDILLGGNPTFLTKSLLEEFFLSKSKESNNKELEEILNLADPKTKLELYEKYDEFLKQNLADLEIRKDPVSILFVNLYKVIFNETKVVAVSEGQKIRDIGGLHVIGTERHESRRIDNQLRGRSGRQGDPGSSRFFLSLEDKLLRIFGGEQILTMMQSIGFQDDTPIQSSLLNKSLESAQKKVEAYYFDTRKQLFEYDQALNTQRNGVYAERRRILKQGNLRNWVLDYAERSLDDLFAGIRNETNEKTAQVLTIKLQNLLGIPFNINKFNSEKDLEQTLAFVKQQLHITYELKELEMESIEKGLLRELEKSFILQQIDYSWQEHLQKITFLRDSIRWRAYGQKDPLTEYKKEAFNYFVMMLARIRHRVVYFVLRTKTIVV